jgi:hypothetical protein
MTRLSLDRLERDVAFEAILSVTVNLLLVVASPGRSFRQLA